MPHGELHRAIVQFLRRQLLQVLVTGHASDSNRRPGAAATARSFASASEVNDKFTDTPTCAGAGKRSSAVASMVRAAAVWLVREVLTVTELFSTRGPAPGPRGI
ncbi:hypothetical protein GCM10009764_03880 [Nocardia ninae]|uniref:Uncharacterized protein n=1 Tax=Nocardia ninae NBRC 108245 TaxID=1210091 RepID=A0A511MGG3_9NOCA|nr:hypothetical protein NN4_42630 [Nocardia ninae NBRC 108245]